MTRTNNNSEYSSSRRSSSSSSSIAQSSSIETTDIISQNELKIQRLLLELQDDLKKTKECYNTSRDVWLSIQQQKIPTSSNENTNSQSLKNNLTEALTNVHNEIDMYRTALEKIAQVRQLQIEIANASKNHNDASRSHTTRRGLADLLSHMAYALKIWYGNEDNDHDTNKRDISPPPLCGAIPAASNHVCHVGDRIAGFVESDDGDENWILAEVASIHGNKTKYDIVDIDAEPDKGHYYNISKRHIIPLPQWRACPLTCPQALFPPRTIVLALYPQTSCFYKGVVESIPRVGKDCYSIIFEDSSYNSGYSPEFDVPQMFVVAYKDVKK
ncbi:unnamed protein product [Rotaria sp. Silwood1]|nr:unnamed protein product [Rotaria sp. Silwood1]CAF1610037.1 unnamed protein product [Rotaria sp. Silwood1]CAF3716066.1 unnamed protein product [Rotaria sp. Silwood1]CAF3740153.1 unnamed protein product [Rotaria sp. Silwood1]CAF4920807.1 unnamed protein product [Rotaria sp. Silwood1]